MVAANSLNISEAGFQSFDGVSIFKGRTLTAGTGITITNGSGTSGDPVITSTATATDLHVAKWIVNSASSSGGNKTTITSALASAVSGETIFVYPGTYTEDLILKAGVNITAFNCDSQTTVSTPNVNIVGSHTATFSGQASYSGIAFSNNGNNNTFTVSGSNATALLFSGCTFIESGNNNMFRYTSSGSPYLRWSNCTAIVNANSTTFFSMTKSSITDIFNSNILNPNATTGANSTFTDCILRVYNSYSEIEFAILTSSGTSVTKMHNSKMSTTNTLCLSFSNTSGSAVITNSSFESGTASAISANGVGGTVVMSHCAVSSSNTNAITGGATLSYAFISFYGSSSTVNTSTQTPLATLI